MHNFVFFYSKNNYCQVYQLLYNHGMLCRPLFLSLLPHVCIFSLIYPVKMLYKYQKYGLPQHNGLMYAIGIAVVMEGILSASYHICPSQSNYQFDTSFMYIIGMLGMLKIYQLRHPDINANAHYLNNLPFWIFFSVIYGITMFAVSIEFYFKGRFFFLVMGNIINVGFLVYGVWHRPKDFPSFLLFPFIANLFLYLLYYIVMKVAHRESLSKRILIYLGSSFVCWSLSMWFFHNLVSNWSVSLLINKFDQTPAISRELNRHCILLDFFDDHDIWHFLSSISIFISFTLMNSIDDDLQFVKRSSIAVF
uniref:YwaF family protein n=1 Tax=Heterorhabditis bacteriophora TaxID=37862 RepID=A0A1I7WQ19_HETBA